MPPALMKNIYTILGKKQNLSAGNNRSGKYIIIDNAFEMVYYHTGVIQSLSGVKNCDWCRKF